MRLRSAREVYRMSSGSPAVSSARHGGGGDKRTHLDIRDEVVGVGAVEVERDKIVLTLAGTCADPVLPYQLTACSDSQVTRRTHGQPRLASSRDCRRADLVAPRQITDPLLMQRRGSGGIDV